MHDWITQVGAGGAFVLIALKLLLDYSKSKKLQAPDDMMADIGKRLLNLENRMGTQESAVSRTVGIMETISSRLDRLEDRMWGHRGDRE